MPGTMNLSNDTGLTNIRSAYEALNRGDKHAARRLAEKALAAAPEREEPWLILAATASPHASTFYLQRALEINPGSIAARSGLEWAQKRQQLSPASSSAAANPAKLPRQSHPGNRWAVFSIAAVAMVIVVTALWFSGSHRPFLPAFLLRWLAPAQISQPATIPPRSSLAAPATPTLTLSFTPLPTHTASPTRLPTDTATATPSVTPLPSPTPQPTSTPLPTATPLPSATPQPTNPPPPTATLQHSSPTVYVVQRGDSLAKIASQFGIKVQDILAANNIANPSRINVGQKITIPGPGTAGSASSSAPAPSSSAPKSIIVDLSQQRLYAYEGDHLVYTFVVSTGSGNSTLTGSFTILDKITDAWSYPWGFWMPDWMGIYWAGSDLENGIHSLPVLSNGQSIWGDALGTPVSYGCVVLGTADADTLFAWAQVGTPVEIRR